MRYLKKCWDWIDYLLNRVLTPRYNPSYWLGAICVFFVWVLLATGLYLYFFYNISAKGAYESVRYLSVEQWYFGGVIRSFHRYASDGLMVAIVLHAVQTFFTDRFRFWRWLAWVTGVGCIWFVVATGMFGYIMVWDERGQFLAQFSALMLDALPVITKPISLAFTQVPSDFFFYIVLFVHFIAPVFLFMLLVVHVMRMKKARINPPKEMVFALLLILFMLSIIKPAMSTLPANLSRLPGDVAFDWFYFFFIPLVKWMPVTSVWLLLTSATLFLFFVPWYFPGRREAAAEVVFENCTGCEQCVFDCPYEAIYVRSRTDNRNYDLEAIVQDKRCAACGICVGSCDYGAINLPFRTEEEVFGEVEKISGQIASEGSGPHLFVFLCDKGVSKKSLSALDEMPSTGYLLLPCIGMVQPAMIKLAFDRDIMDGVVLAGCQEGDCHYRYGNLWLQERIEGLRKPVLRRMIDKTRIRLIMASEVQGRDFLAEIEFFRVELSERMGDNG